MDNLLNLLVSLKSVIWGAALVVGVIVFLGLVNRFLQRNAAKVPGRQFRNQIIMTGAGFCGLLIVILGLPIDTTMRGQLLALIGIIISAGIMLKTLSNFHSGDFIQVGNYLGTSPNGACSIRKSRLRTATWSLCPTFSWPPLR